MSLRKAIPLGCTRRALHDNILTVRPQAEHPVRSESTNIASNDNSQEHISDPFTGAELSVFLNTEILSKARAVQQSLTVPDAALVEQIFQACEELALMVAEEIQSSTNDPGPEHTPAAKLLSLEEGKDLPKCPGRKNAQSMGSTRNAIARLLSSTAYRVVTDPKVYITSQILSSYVRVQTLLGCPRTLPEIFKLYAGKPVPKPKSSPIRYSAPYPYKPSAHIPLEIAKVALTAAIRTKNLPLCFDIIDRSVCAPAYRVSKFFRKAFAPFAAAALAPFAIYKLASELSSYQSTMDSAMATRLLFAGTMAYVGFTATIGAVAVTTANDQMDRVTWATGTPLRDRWTREEERMLIDRVAGAWGFQQRWRRGEEEGQDWEALREWIGMRGMVLDKTELMDGME
ncbi:MAG: hypothetical protein L6R35_005850 [Caloplaca aegaea]|nr:MAG: hypothetical protein L6R35_005850 [Caloplaca aegaea]